MAPVLEVPSTASLKGFLANFGRLLPRGHRLLVTCPLSPDLQGSPLWEGRGVSFHGLRPIFLIKQLGEGCSYPSICSLSSGMGETATSWLIRDVGYVSSGKDDCVLLAGSSLACLSMVMHSLVFKKASFKIHRCRKRLRRWIPSL